MKNGDGGSLNERVLILDFGSQYTQLIARRVRELKVYAEIIPYHGVDEYLDKNKPSAIILSGGPSSVYENGAPQISDRIFNLEVPVLGICYGFYIIVNAYNGKIVGSDSREYGRSVITIKEKSELFKKLGNKEQVWMSHGDKVISLPDGFKATASSDNCEIAAAENYAKKIFGVQFHPEVFHTTKGGIVLHNFIFGICKLKASWTMESYIQSAIKMIKEDVGDGTVLLGLSGGVDSSVTAELIHRAVGNRLYCVFVNHGLLRKNEAEEVINRYGKAMKLNLIYVDASKRFLNKLKNVEDPEKKRKIIGKEFVSVFMEEAKKIGKFDFLAQGTIYPDVIESVSVKGPSDAIKSHHNRVPEILKLIKSGKVVEPLKELFKDEVRDLGIKLGLSDELINRHPFPGPGLAIRIIGNITEERIKILQNADDIIVQEIRNHGLYNKLWQIFAVYLPIRSVGVMGDKRTYENVIAIRGVTSVDAMTADWAYLPEDLLRRISNRIINEVRGINRVVYDISSKPPSTIEWE